MAFGGFRVQLYYINYNLTVPRGVRKTSPVPSRDGCASCARWPDCGCSAWWWPSRSRLAYWTAWAECLWPPYRCHDAARRQWSAWWKTASAWRARGTPSSAQSRTGSAWWWCSAGCSATSASDVSATRRTRRRLPRRPSKRTADTPAAWNYSNSLHRNKNKTSKYNITNAAQY